MATFSKGTKTLALKETLGKCGYCATEILLSFCELDHVIPRSKGGTGSRKKNLIASCIKCNRSKGRMKLKDFKEKIKVKEFWFEKLNITKGEIYILDQEKSENLNIDILKAIKINPYSI